MSLMNVYQVYSIKPHVTYRFQCEIWPYGRNRSETDYLTFAVKKISQPVFKLDTANRQHFGNTQYLVPVFKFGDTEMTITFEETDNMDVYKFIVSQLGPYAFNNPGKNPLLNIEITQFDESMRNIVDNKVYVGFLKAYDTPSFNNNDYGHPVDLTATFYIEYVYEEEQEISEFKVSEGKRERVVSYSEKNFKKEIDTAEKWEFEHATPTERAWFAQNDKVNAKREQISKKIEEIDNANNELVYSGFKKSIDLNREEYINEARNAWVNEYTDNSSDLYAKREAHEEFDRMYNDMTEEERDILIIKYKFGVDATDGIDGTEFRKLRNETQNNVFETENIGDIAHLLKQKMQLENEMESLKYTGRTTQYKSSGNPFSVENYDKNKEIDQNTFRNTKSNGWCAAYTSTELSKKLELDKRLTGVSSGKDYVSDEMVRQINATGKGQAKILDIQINSISDLQELQNRKLDKDTTLVVSIDLDSVSGENRGKFTAESLKHGHVVTVDSEGISQGQRSAVTYSAITDDMIRSREVKFRVMEVKKKKDF